MKVKKHEICRKIVEQKGSCEYIDCIGTTHNDTFNEGVECPLRYSDCIDKLSYAQEWLKAWEIRKAQKTVAKCLETLKPTPDFPEYKLEPFPISTPIPEDLEYVVAYDSFNDRWETFHAKFDFNQHITHWAYPLPTKNK
jgi:hypothetical protein